MLRFLILACAVSAIHAVECGVPAIPPNEMSVNIVGGNEAKPNSWPWMTEVVLDGMHYCGGTLINNQWVVSAAHCFNYNPSRYQFSVGGHKSASYVGGLYEPTRQTFSSEEIIIHEQYNSDSMANDIALIKLDDIVQFNENVSPACLGEVRPADGTPAFVTGWGGLDQKEPGDNTNIYPKVLQQVMVPIVSQEACEAVYPRFSVDMIAQTMICAGYIEGGKDSCQADSGGPMVVKVKTGFNKEQWSLAGIVSWGFGCAYEGYYGVYSDVAHLNQWIIDTMANRS